MNLALASLNIPLHSYLSRNSVISVLLSMYWFSQMKPLEMVVLRFGTITPVKKAPESLLPLSCGHREAVASEEPSLTRYRAYYWSLTSRCTCSGCMHNKFLLLVNHPDEGICCSWPNGRRRCPCLQDARFLSWCFANVSVCLFLGRGNCSLACLFIRCQLDWVA